MRRHGGLIFAVGNAPTALVRLYELIREGKITPELIIGVPVGFVNVVQSKELILESAGIRAYIGCREAGKAEAISRPCICNALLLYMMG